MSLPRAAILAVALAFAVGPALAQAPIASKLETDTAERDRQAQTMREIERSVAASSENRTRIEREIGDLQGDRAKLNQALIDAAARQRETEERLAALEDRLQTLSASQDALKKSLESRRGVIAEVLAALQRMGRRPPPAVLVRPEDVLGAIRTSMLLGAVVPELQGEAETLAGDLAELVRLRGLIAADREGLRRDLAGWATEQERLKALIAARQDRIGEAEREAGSERARAATLATEAKSAKDLVERMESEVSAARRAADEAKRAGEAQARQTRERFAAAAFRDPARLAPKIPFAEARGLLPRPAAGEIVKAFGVAETEGGTTRGVSFATRSKAVVASPADGWVSFAGPFRSYGRLLIINAGDGYYLLLAGMDRIDVEVGQFVLAGEPVASMGASGGASGVKDPTLYVEFRKDGGSIDPQPWWARGSSEKVRG